MCCWLLIKEPGTLIEIENNLKPKNMEFQLEKTSIATGWIWTRNKVFV